MAKPLEAEERGFECLDGASDVFIVADDIRIPASKVSLKIENGLYWKKERRGDVLVEPPIIKIGILFEEHDDGVDALFKKTREKIEQDDKYQKWEIHGNGNVIAVRVIRVPNVVPVGNLVHVVALWAEGFETWAETLAKAGLFQI